MKFLPRFLLACLFLFTFAAAAHAVKVVTKTSYSNDGVCDSDCSLNEAVNTAASGELITFNIPAASCPGGVCTVTLGTNYLFITKSLTIRGNGTNNTILKQDATTNSLFWIAAGTVNFENLTINGGANNGSQTPGGAIYNDTATVNLTNVNVTGSTARYGGGIYNTGALSIYTSSITSNQATGLNDSRGGGIFNTGSGRVYMEESTVSGNSAVSAGGIFNDSYGTVEVRLSTFYDNRVSLYGGAILNNGTLYVRTSTLSNNVSDYQGAAIFNYSYVGTTAEIYNSTFTGNRYFARILNGQDEEGVIYTPTFSILTQNVIAGNFEYDRTGVDVYGNYNSGGYNFIGWGLSTPLNAPVAGDRIGSYDNTLDPRLAPLGNYGGKTLTNVPLGGSLVINTGSNSLIGLFVEQRGFSRVREGTVDVGAVENNINISPTAAALPNANLNSSYSQTISAATINSLSEKGAAFDQFESTFAVSFQYSIVSGALPNGLTLNSNTGVISGTPIGSTGTYNFIVKAQDTSTSGNPAGARQYSITVLAPTAATVSISGRVFNHRGRAVARAQISLTDANGTTRIVQTNSFGFYYFDNVSAGETYIISVNHKSYDFESRSVTVAEAISNLDFYAR